MHIDQSNPSQATGNFSYLANSNITGSGRQNSKIGYFANRQNGAVGGLIAGPRRGPPPNRVMATNLAPLGILGPLDTKSSQTCTTFVHINKEAAFVCSNEIDSST